MTFNKSQGEMDLHTKANS